LRAGIGPGRKCLREMVAADYHARPEAMRRAVIAFFDHKQT
jgi:hypothetical protein